MGIRCSRTALYIRNETSSYSYLLSITPSYSWVTHQCLFTVNEYECCPLAHWISLGVVLRRVPKTLVERRRNHVDSCTHTRHTVLPRIGSSIAFVRRRNQVQGAKTYIAAFGPPNQTLEGILLMSIWHLTRICGRRLSGLLQYGSVVRPNTSSQVTPSDRLTV